MGVGNFQQFEQALDRAVLAPAPVQRVEDDVGLHVLQNARDVLVDVDGRDLESAPLERRDAGAPGVQRHLALRRPAAHQDRNVLGHAHLVAQHRSRQKAGPASVGDSLVIRERRACRGACRDAPAFIHGRSGLAIAAALP